jgi:hypothetical protein
MPQSMQKEKDNKLKQLRDVVLAQGSIRRPKSYAAPMEAPEPSGFTLSPAAPLDFIKEALKKAQTMDGSKRPGASKRQEGSSKATPVAIDFDAFMSKPLLPQNPAYDKFINSPLPKASSDQGMPKTKVVSADYKPKEADAMAPTPSGQTFAEAVEAANKRRKLGVGLDNLGRGMTSNIGIWNRRGGELISTPVRGSNAFEKAADIDKQNVLEQEGIRKDILTPEQRQFIESSVLPSGTKLPEDYTMSQVEKFMPLFAQQLRKREYGENRELRREQMDALADERALRHGRLPDKIVSELKDKKNTLDAIERIRQFKDKAPGETGPIVGRINNLLARWGGTSPEVAKLNSEVRSVLSAYGKSISGAAIAEPEMRRLEAQLPQMINPGDTFDALLERFKVQAETDYNNTVDYFGKQGRNVDPYKLSQTEASKSVGTGKVVTIVSPDGKQTLYIPDSDSENIDGLKKLGWKVK